MLLRTLGRIPRFIFVGSERCDLYGIQGSNISTSDTTFIVTLSQILVEEKGGSRFSGWHAMLPEMTLTDCPDDGCYE